MKELTALHFPETYPLPAFRALLLLFESVHFLAIDEKARHDSARQLAGDELIHGVAPAPLGNDRQRFQRLVQDLKGHAGEFYGSFLSSFGREAVHPDEESVLRLVKGMTGSAGSAPDAAAPNETLWQARLVLRLAEILTEEEQEVRARLTSVAQREAALFKALHGDDAGDDDPLPLAAMPAMTEPSSPLRTDHLVRAWAHLFLADAELAPYWLLTTASSEAALLFREVYERRQGQAAVDLGSVPLAAPSQVPAADFIAERTALRQNGHEALSRFAALLAALCKAPAGLVDSKTINELGVTLAALTEALAPPASAGADRWTLTFTLLPGASPDRLCRWLCRYPDKGQADRGAAATVIAQLCRQRP